MAKINFLNNLLKKILISLVRFYQVFLTFFLKSNHCRFQPTCSNYMIDAINQKGIIFGVLSGIWRILRCNPFNKNPGFDPVCKNKLKSKSQ